MQYTTLGRTGMKVSVAGLGAGGSSRVGLKRSLSHAESVGLIRYAFDLGVNFVDTAANYDTEHIVGDAVAQVPRDSIIISTKCGMREGGLTKAPDLVVKLEQSLKLLKTDYIDVYHLHAVNQRTYDHSVTELLPEMQRQRDLGKIRWIALSESAPVDFEHEVMQRVVADGFWDVAMVAFNMTHQNAKRTLFPGMRAKGIGSLNMIAVRQLFSRPQLLAETMRKLAQEGKVPAWLGETDEPLSFLVHDGGASSVIDACYRFSRHHSGVDVVLFGTGSRAHMLENVASINKPPLPEEDVKKIDALFGALVGVGVEGPDR